ncbi:peptidoglycan-binding protein [Aureimonas sp. AU12]|uniref:peptidoglycan-binding protein n=1 Tax=Aureimonas sp. AU12 TaxID=1638161 RepID=UPI0007851558|nr:peptidoglycan-binding protein [Aureimonas sp. AU12]
MSKTLEDLEARLSRLSSAKRDEPAATGDESSLSEASEAPGERMRMMAAERRARRPSLADAVSALTVERQLSADPVSDRPAPRTRPTRAGSPIERRMGTIAGEVEQIQLQGATLAMVKDLAEELSALRADIQARETPDLSPRLEELRRSFADLKQMIADREGPDRIGAEIFEIMEALTELTAGTADQTSLDALRTELDSVAAMVGQLAREESVEAVQRRWDAFETRIGDRIELDNQAKRDLRVELERLRGSLRSLATEEQILAVQQRWEEFESRYLETARIQTEETLTRFLRDELGALRTKLDLIVEQNAPEALDARFDAMAERFSTKAVEGGIARLSERMGEIELALVGLPEILQIDQMEARIQALAESVELLAAEIREPDLDHFSVLEERLDEISAAIVSATVHRQVSLDMAPIERIEARVAEIASRVERLSEAGDADLLSEQIAVLTERVEELGARPDADLGRRIDTLAERVEILFANSEPKDTSSRFEARLTELAERIELSAGAKGVDPAVMMALEAQIGRLADHLAGAPIAFGEEGSEVSRRLDALERQLDENRDSILMAARTAADEAVRRMQGEDGRRENEYVRELAQDLRNLETLCRESDERAFGVFDAVHTTLHKIVERLTAIESELRSDAANESKTVQPSQDSAGRIDWAASEAAPDAEPKGLRAAINRHLTRRGGKEPAAEVPTLAERVHPTVAVMADPVAATLPSVEPAALIRSNAPLLIDAPSIDAAESVATREANRPLEPGSGAPDIAALIERVRQQQRGIEPPTGEPLAKADFIAAARKAAMAAAAEAEAIRDRTDADADGLTTKDQAGRRRKPILMAVGAVLLALMAMPLGRAYFGPQDGVVAAPVAEVDDGSQIAAAAPTPAIETPAPVLDTESTATIVPAPAPAEMSAATEEVAPPVVAEAPAAELPTVEAPITATATMPVTAEVAAEPAVNVAPVAATAQGTLLASAEAKLPEAARGAVPAMPDGIGPAALGEAVAKGEPMAMFEVGLRLMEGRSAPSDPVAALNWFGQSASRGFAPAQYSVGTLFEKGNGIGRDTGAARDWYLLAADQGNIRAMHNLAVLYATGIEGKSDPETAAQWFVKAADHGMRDSQYNLGILYARGAGVEQDLSQSYRWFQIVGQAGDKDALAKMEEVGKTLSPEVRTRIDAEVAAWKPAARNEGANTVEIPPAWSAKGDQTASVDMGRAVRNVQAILIKLGYNPGRPDGVVGSQTTTAIREFQEKSGLQATGKIDEPLIRALLERKDA